MRVLFIYPNLDCQIGFNYGVASLSAVLKKAGHETSLININEKLGPVPSADEIVRRIESWRPGLVGFSAVTTQFEYVKEVSARIRERSRVPIAVGGVHATMVPAEVMDVPSIDFACVGECEESLPELVSALETGKDATRLRGVWARRDGRTVGNPVRPLPNLSALPMKDYSIFDFQRMIDAKDGWVGLMASRGCPYRCTYCFNHEMFNRYREDLGVSASGVNYVRHHPVGHLLDEIGFLLSNYSGIRMFIFDDDLFTHDRDYVLDFCARYPGVSDVPLTVNAHVKRFDSEIASALKRAGCRLVKFGIESGSPRIRKEVMNRHMSNAEIAGAFRTAHEAGLETSAFLMFGLPREGEREIMETVGLLAETRPTRFRWSIFYPFPGTRAHRMAEEEGFIDPGKMKSLRNFFEESCLDFGPDLNLFIKKLRRTLPWQVNASMPESAAVYGPLLDAIAGIPEKPWDEWQGAFVDLDRRLSELLAAAGTPHYSVKYNEFMAVLNPGGQGRGKEMPA